MYRVYSKTPAHHNRKVVTIINHGFPTHDIIFLSNLYGYNFPVFSMSLNKLTRNQMTNTGTKKFRAAIMGSVMAIPAEIAISLFVGIMMLTAGRSEESNET